MRTARANFAEHDIRITTLIDALIEVWKLCREKSPSRDILTRNLPRAVFLLQRSMMVFKTYSPSGMNFPKFHMLRHLAKAAELFGPPWLQTTEYSESNHKPLKASVSHTSFNIGYQQHAGADYLRRQELLRIDKQLENIEEKPQQSFNLEGQPQGHVVASAQGKCVGEHKILTLRELLSISEKQPAMLLPVILLALFGQDVSSMTRKGPMPTRIFLSMNTFLGLDGNLSYLIYNFVLDLMQQKHPRLLIDQDLLSMECVFDIVNIYTSAFVFLDCGPVGKTFKQRRRIVADSHNRKRGECQ